MVMVMVIPAPLDSSRVVARRVLAVYRRHCAISSRAFLLSFAVFIAVTVTVTVTVTSPITVSTVPSSSIAVSFTFFFATTGSVFTAGTMRLAGLIARRPVFFRGGSGVDVTTGAATAGAMAMGAMGATACTSVAITVTFAVSVSISIAT